MVMILPPGYRFHGGSLHYKQLDGELILATKQERVLIRRMHLAHSNNDKVRFEYLTTQVRALRALRITQEK